MRPIDTVVTLLPFFVVFSFEFFPFLIARSGAEGDEGRNDLSRLGLLLSLEDQLEQSIQDEETSGYELLCYDGLEAVVRRELSENAELGPDELEDVENGIVTSVQHEVSADTGILASISKDHAALINDRMEVIITGGATVISFIVVLYSRATGSTITLGDLAITMAAPLILLFVILGLVLFLAIGSPLQYGALRNKLGYSPVSIGIMVANIGIGFAIVYLDVCIIGYQ